MNSQISGIYNINPVDEVFSFLFVCFFYPVFSKFCFHGNTVDILFIHLSESHRFSTPAGRVMLTVTVPLSEAVSPRLFPADPLTDHQWISEVAEVSWMCDRVKH